MSYWNDENKDKIPSVVREEIVAAISDTSAPVWPKYGPDNVNFPNYLKVEPWERIHAVPLSSALTVGRPGTATVSTDPYADPDAYASYSWNIVSYDNFFEKVVKNPSVLFQVPSKEKLETWAPWTDSTSPHHLSTSQIDAIVKERDDLLSAASGFDFNADPHSEWFKRLYQLFEKLLGIPYNLIPVHATGWTSGPPTARYSWHTDPEGSLIVDMKDVLLYLYNEESNSHKASVLETSSDLDKMEGLKFDHDDPVDALKSQIRSRATKDLKDYQSLDDNAAIMLNRAAEDDRDYLQSLIRESAQNVLRLNLGSFYKANSQWKKDNPDMAPAQAATVRESAASTLAPPYSKQIYLAYGESQNLINVLANDPESHNFLNIRTHEASQIVPMIRLYKNYFDQNNKTEGEVEFSFPGATDPLDPRSGVGIKSFEWKYNATNPATIKNDIEAKLVLYFQDFSDLTKIRNGYDTINARPQTFQYQDLLIRPPGAKGISIPISSAAETKAGCSDKTLVYDPRFYEIKAVVGWAPVDKISSPQTENIVEAIENQQVPMFLTLIDHTFTFTQEGTFELEITYRARLEALTEDPRMDVLSTPAVKEEINKKLKRIADLQQTCGADSLIEAERDNITRIKEKSRDDLASSIINGLEDKIFISTVNYRSFLEAIVGEDGRRAPAATAPTAGKGDYLKNWKSLFISPGDVSNAVLARAKTLSPAAAASLENARARLVTSYAPSHPQSKSEEEAEGPDDVMSTGGILEARTPGSKAQLLNIPWFYFGDLANLVISRTLTNSTPIDADSPGIVPGLELENLNFLFSSIPINRVHIAQNAYGRSANEINQETLKAGLGQTPDTQYASARSTSARTYQYGQGSIMEECNLADVPIALETFNQWYIKKIINTNRGTYPLQQFLKDFLEDVVIAIINKKGFQANRWFIINYSRSVLNALNISVPFYEGTPIALKTAAISLPSTQSPFVAKSARRTTLGENPLEKLRYFNYNQASDDNYYRCWINAQKFNPGEVEVSRRKNSHENTVENSYHLSVFYCINDDTYRELGPPRDPAETREQRDYRKGIYHLYLGADRGVVKEVEFSKVDAPFLREARMQQDALNPLGSIGPLPTT